ncbi:MAG: DMT family transporter [candidate division Zixibacteria bacterium]|nr:DMT family transporter [candidate division Zixibacteria bacterium]
MKTSSRLKNTALTNLVFGAILISFSPVFVKLAHVGPTIAGVYRMLFGGIVLAIIAIIRRDKFWSGRKPFLWTCLIGLIFALDLTAWHRCIHYIGPGLSTLLGNFQVFILTGFGVLVLKEKLTRQFLFAVPLAMAGLILIFGWRWQQFDVDYKIGFILGIITAISYAIFTLALRYLQSRENSLSPIVNLTIISFITTIFMAIFSLAQSESFIIPDWQSWGSLIGLGIVCQAVAWLIIARTLPKIKASLAGLILLLQPTLAFVWDILFFDRPTTGLEILGALIALAAIYLGSSNNTQ